MRNTLQGIADKAFPPDSPAHGRHFYATVRETLNGYMVMNFKNIAIIGVGLIGSSFALSLKARGFSGRITGIGRNEDNLLRAEEMGIIDAHTTVHAEGVRNADLVLLASPVGRFEQIINDVRHELKAGAIVTDVGSVKAGVIRILEPLMPPGVNFVGGHPIAGKECSGIDAATADLFTGARCIITPSPRTDREALDTVVGMWEEIGSRTLLMNPEEHDLIFAAVSHLPHVVAYALVNTIIDVDGGILHHGGNGLRDMTRIALSPAELWRDICIYNREEILGILRKFSSYMSRIIKLMEETDWSGLEKEFARAKEARRSIEPDQHKK